MRRRIALASVALALAVGAGAAWAYITSTGSGTGVATTGSLATPSIEASAATPTTALLPGASGDATFKLDNPNAFAVTIIAVASSGSITVSGAPGCTSVNDGVSFTTQSALSIVVPASAVGFVVDLPGALSMSASSASSCQGASFSIPIVASVQQG